MPTPIDDLILSRAAEMAEQDGDVLSTLYIVTATNNLQVELFAARDRILALHPVPMIVAGASHEANSVPERASVPNQMALEPVQAESTTEIVVDDSPVDLVQP